MKNTCSSLLISLILFTTAANAQYADDNTTIRDNYNAKDPFKPRKKNKTADSIDVYEPQIISLPRTDLNTKLDISDIRIINAVSDSSLLGYVHSTIFNILVKAIPDKLYTTYLQSYVDRSYSPIYKKNAAPFVWVIQELRIGERTFNMGEKGYVHLKAVIFAGNDNGTFKRLRRLDTILVKGGIDVTHKHGKSIADALGILLRQSLTRENIDSPLYTLSDIQEEALQRYQKPALQSKEHAEGIYLTFDEFINDQPSVKNAMYSLEHNRIHFFYTDSTGKKTIVEKFWGVRKNGLLFKKYYALLIPVEQKENRIILTNYLSLSRRMNNMNLMGGLLGAAIAGAGTSAPAGDGILPVVENIPYIGKKMPFATGVDIETGEFIL